MKFSLIVATDQNNLMALNGIIPWYDSNDLRFFKEYTVGKTVVMGRKTYDSIGRPLPKRKNIILTKSKKYESESKIMVFKEIDQVLTYASTTKEEIIIIGGLKVYQSFLHENLIDLIVWNTIKTKIHSSGEALYFNIDYNQWNKVEEEDRESFISRKFRKK